jgi:murein L,D-transpeptidase YcbB/YkuD
MNDLLVARFERYFRHPDRKKNVLGRGDQAVACANVRWAVELLGIDLTRDDPGTNLFDENLEAAVKEFQKRYHHRVVDGRVGPETRKLLVSTLLGRHAPIFSNVQGDLKLSEDRRFSCLTLHLTRPR